MQTLITDSPEEAANILNRGGIVAFPTETVYGLGADAFNPDAVAGIFRAKGRPSDNPLIVHVHSPEQIQTVAGDLDTVAEQLVARFFPGPLTLVLSRRPSVPDVVAAGLPTVGVRCPSHPVASAFLGSCRHPVAAPSANRSGRPSPTDWRSVAQDLDGRIDCILRGTPSTIGLESTIVDCTVTPPMLLRSGAVSLESLRELVPDLQVGTACKPGETPKSPGMKYRHYSPDAAVILLEPGACGQLPRIGQGTAWIGLSTPPPGVPRLLRCTSATAYARALFGFFRDCDAEGITTIYCEIPPLSGIGRAIRDRLTKAAGHS